MSSPLLGTDALPSTVVIGGRAYPIRHDFRDGIRFEMLMCDKTVPEAMKVALALKCWFAEIPDEDLGAVIDAMLTFYRCGKPDNPEGEVSEQVYSYAHDYDLIYAAFLSAYGIDLFDVEELHWWRFRAMLAALPEDCQLMKVIGYRATPITSDTPKETRKWLSKMKRLHALPELADSRPKRLTTEEEFRQAIEDVRRAKLEGL